MATRDPPFEAWIERARDVSVRQELSRRGLWTKALTGGAPCPGCGGNDRFSVNLKKDVWFCRVSGLGGDAIALAQHIDGTEFFVAVETLTGEPPPGRGSTLTPEEKSAIQKNAEVARAAGDAKRKNDEETAQRFRERERRAAWDIWDEASPIAGTLGQDYLALRGLIAPYGARLRFHASIPLWDRPKDQGGYVLHKGPVLIAAIEGPKGAFSGIQRIWIDLTKPQGKAIIVHPKTGEILPSKKTRGSVKGGTILLVRGGVYAEFPGDRRGPMRLFLGEGIETVLSVYCALSRANSPLLDGAEFRTSIDLGNLAGKAVKQVRHPTQKRIDKNGIERPFFVPGNEPKDDPDFPLIRIAESVTDLWLLGDGDSEPFFTRMALERAAKRFAGAHPRLTVRLAMAAPGVDFNDMWLGEKAA